MSAGLRPAPFIPKPLTKADKLAIQAKAVRKHHRDQWEKEMTELRAAGQKVGAYPGFNPDAPATGEEPKAAAPEATAPPGKQTAGEAFADLGKEEKPK